MRNSNIRLRAFKIAVLLSLTCAIIYAGRYDSIDYFTRDFISAIESKNTDKFIALTLPESEAKIRAKYGDYLGLMVRSDQGYFLTADSSNLLEVTEETINNSQRIRWFGYLSQPETVRLFRIKFQGSTIPLYCTRTLTGWRHVIQSPSEFFPDS